MNRFEEDYNNLNLIYEKYYGESYSAPRMAGGQQAAAIGSPSYRKDDLPMGVSGNGGNLHASNSLPDTVSPVSNEEMSEDTHISKVDILAKVDEMIEDAQSTGMYYAIHQLASLKKFISC